jgi:thiamine biosynthesis lipoprotein
MELDWGGIAKGFAVDRAFLALKKLGVRNGFINAGGNLRCWGKNPDGTTWRIGIKHPRKPGFLGILRITGLSAATSGDYQRFFEKGGVRYHHIFDPRTGYPVRGKQSVTVIGPEGVVCDALSTALFVNPSPEEVLKKFEDYGALLVNRKGILSAMGRKFSFQVTPGTP